MMSLPRSRRPPAFGAGRRSRLSRTATATGTESYRWLSWNAVPDEGKIYATVRDVTAIKEQAQALAHAEDALRQAQKNGGGGATYRRCRPRFQQPADHHPLVGGLPAAAEPPGGAAHPVQWTQCPTRWIGAAKLTGQLLAFARRQALLPEVFDVGTRLDDVADMLNSVTAPGSRSGPSSRTRAVMSVPIRASSKPHWSTWRSTPAMPCAAKGELTIRVDRGRTLPAIRGHAGAQGPFVAISVIDAGCGSRPITCHGFSSPSSRRRKSARERAWDSAK